MLSIFSKPILITEDVRIKRAIVERFTAEWLMTEKLKKDNGFPGPYDTPLHAMLSSNITIEDIHSVARAYGAENALGFFAMQQAETIRDPRLFGRRIQKFMKTEW